MTATLAGPLLKDLPDVAVRLRLREMVARNRCIGQTARLMYLRSMLAESKKKLWRPCREARALGL